MGERWRHGELASVSRVLIDESGDGLEATLEGLFATSPTADWVSAFQAEGSARTRW